MTRVHLQPGFVLHTRAYRDSSVIVEVFSKDYGRLSLLAKGQRSASARAKLNLAPFSALSLSWQGKGDLKLLVGAELIKASPALTEERLYCAFYLNELLVRLLPAHDPHTDLFDVYDRLLTQLPHTEELEAELRCFEIILLDQLGYGISFTHVAETGQAIIVDSYYQFVPDYGFRLVEQQNVRSSERFFNGEVLLAMAEGDYSQAETLVAAKKLLRLALAPHLGDRPLKSRELFRKS